MVWCIISQRGLKAQRLAIGSVRRGNDQNLFPPLETSLHRLPPIYAIARNPSHFSSKILPLWIFEAWHFILSRELGLPYKPPAWLKQPAVMAVPTTTPQVLSRLGSFKDDLRPFTVMTVPFPKRETVRDPLWTGYFIMQQKDR